MLTASPAPQHILGPINVSQHGGKIRAKGPQAYSVCALQPRDIKNSIGRKRLRIDRRCYRSQVFRLPFKDIQRFPAI